MQRLLSSIAASLLAVGALGHYTFNQFTIEGEINIPWKYVRPHYNTVPQLTIFPVKDVFDPAIRCNNHSSPAEDVAIVSAGANVGFAGTKVIHPGPFMAYLARAPDGVDIKEWDAEDAEWFKIWELGELSRDLTREKYKQVVWDGWDTDNTQWNFTIPEATPSGQYLLRFEHIALHIGATYPGPEHYISCVQLDVRDGGEGRPEPTVRFPGGYDETTFPLDIWGDFGPLEPEPFEVPGPAVWRG